MPFASRRPRSYASPPALPSARSRARHGRDGRSPVTGPDLPLVHTRLDQFEATVQATADYLQDLWPDELADLRIEVLPMPDQPPSVNGVARWRVLPQLKLVVLYRIPIERMSRLHKEDDWHRRLMVESCVAPGTLGAEGGLAKTFVSDEEAAYTKAGTGTPEVMYMQFEPEYRLILAQSKGDFLE